MSGHALLSASKAERWLNCPPSARLEETLPDSTSEYAQEGTLAHAIGELKLRKYTTPMATKTYNAELKKLQAGELYKNEMLEHTEAYLDYIKKTVLESSSKPYIAIEQKLDFSSYVPEGFGTADCVVVSGNTLHVIDFKYGQGVLVTAEANPQMMLYALGTLEAYSFLYDIKTVKLAIIQPRKDNISEWEVSITELMAWAENAVKPIADMAFKGEGEYCPGDYCRFCKAKNLCRARADQTTALEDFADTAPALLHVSELGPLLVKARRIKKWIEDLEKFTLSEAIKGNKIPGWKIVGGKSSRKFTDAEAAFRRVIESGINEAMLYTRKPLAFSDIEKLVGKTKFSELLGDLIIKAQGKPTLATIDDKREELTITTAFDDFNDDEGEDDYGSE